jgi:hypothetical protein
MKKFTGIRWFFPILDNKGMEKMASGNSMLPPNIQNKFHKQKNYEPTKNKCSDAAKGQ